MIQHQFKFFTETYIQSKLFKFPTYFISPYNNCLKMKLISILLLAVIVTLSMETGTAKYLLVEMDHTGGNGGFTN